MLALYKLVGTSLVVLAYGEASPRFNPSNIQYAGAVHNPGSDSLVFFCLLLNITNLLR